MDVQNFAKDIEAKAAGEPIEAIVIGDHGGNTWDSEDGKDGYLEPTDRRFIPVEKRHVVLSWDEARPLLDYEYDAGYGGCDCHPIWAWTPQKVLYVGEYDGSTWVESAPRHPSAGNPETT